MMKKSPAKKNASAGAKKLDALRKKIDVLDGRLVSLLNQRSRIAQAIGRLKHRAGGALYVPERERDVLARVRKRNRGPLSNKALESIYREIMSAALALEGAMDIGVLGDAAGVARNLFGASATYVPAGSPSAAVAALCAGRWQALCLPEAAVTAACAELDAGRLRACGPAVNGVVVLVRGGA